MPCGQCRKKCPWAVFKNVQWAVSLQKQEIQNIALKYCQSPKMPYGQLPCGQLPYGQLPTGQLPIGQNSAAKTDACVYTAYKLVIVIVHVSGGEGVQYGNRPQG